MTDTSGIKNIIFDMGDVLIHYRWKQMLMDYGLEEEAAIRIGAEMFDDPDSLWHDYDLDLYPQDEIIRKYAEKYPQDGEAIAWFIRHGEYMVVPRPRVWEAVHRLKGLGYGIYLLSNYPRELFLKHTEYADFMADLDGKLISYEVRKGKPDADFFELLCARYSLNPFECIFFDDRQENVEGAMRVGMKARRVLSQDGLLQDLKGLEEEVQI